MESRYFKRDISWLSFNYRVLLEAEDDTLPLYERINFISIYSSNLEEFYKIRVADHKAIATGAAHSDEESVQSAMQLVTEINEEVKPPTGRTHPHLRTEDTARTAATSHNFLPEPQRGAFP